EVARPVLDGPTELLADRPDLAHQRVLARLARVLHDEVDDPVRVADHACEEPPEEARALRERGGAERGLRPPRALDREGHRVGRVDRDLTQGARSRGLVARDDERGMGSEELGGGHRSSRTVNENY